MNHRVYDDFTEKLHQAETSPGSEHCGRGKELPHGRQEKGNFQGVDKS